VTQGEAGVVYVQDKLGGEISISATPRSPELSFDITLVEVIRTENGFGLGKYGIFEVQTMDFHGTYRHVVKNLGDALRLHGNAFHASLQENQRWLSDHVEGPNIANVFKRTFYQMMLKFQIGADESCAGCALAIPVSVWDSWQRHLGKPEIEELPEGVFELRYKAPGQDALGTRAPAWIYVFDVDPASNSTPNSIILHRVIATAAESVAHYALEVAPKAAVEGIGTTDRVLASIRARLTQWWPEIGRGPVVV